MKKKLAFFLAVLMVFTILAGCTSGTDTGTKTGTGAEQPNDGEKPPAVEDNKVRVAYVAMTNGSAQVFINQKYNIFSEQLGTLGKEVEYIAAHGLQEVYPLLDKEEGAPDFMYLPHTAFSTYNTKKSKYGGSEKYMLIAASVNSNDINLVTRPEIKSLKDLDGKKVGIANLRYADDYQLNKVLSAVGLKTSTYGGTVEIVWDNIVSDLWNNYGEGKYAAIVNFDNANNLPKAKSMVPGSKVYSLNPDGLFGRVQPRLWLVAKKELVRDNPELVKAFLKGHILSTEKAIEKIHELPEINRELRMAWFEGKGVQQEVIDKENELEIFRESWNEAEISYDPNMDYIKGLFDYMVKEGHFSYKTLDEFASVELLNEVLQEMGKPPVKQEVWNE